ncbi:MAG: 16S rRNA (uracil(1498)-N(3))-methyltransferase [Spirochaetota bacterium]
MNMILLTGADLTGDNMACLTEDRRVTHIQTVLKAGTGDVLHVGLLGGKRGRGTVVEQSAGRIVLSISLFDDPPAPLPLILVIGMCRPKSFRKALHYAVAMGVKQIHVIKTWRVDKSYWSSPVLEETNLRSEMVLALEQSQDTIMPSIRIHTLFKPFVQDIFPELSAKRLRLLAHPYNAQRCPADIQTDAVLVVGPEGGFIQYEVDTFLALGCIPVTTGRRILRVENAVPALLGRMF